MRIVGIIAEYNPFHNGHAYQIEQVKAQTHCDYCVAIMSGNFVQRGFPSFLDKYTRTEMALKNGIDLVCELPIIYSTASAEFFATGAILALDKLGIVTDVCFGAECDDMELLQSIADCLLFEPIIYKTALQSFLRKGLSFPRSRTLALAAYRKDINNLEDILKQPNNILAIEYLKAIKKYNCKLTPLIIKRKLADYHNSKIESTICSSSAIRKTIQNTKLTTNLELCKSAMPTSAYKLLKTHYGASSPIVSEQLTPYIQYCILLNSNMDDILDLNTELTNRILKAYQPQATYADYITNVASKHYTEARISRALLHIILNIRTTDMLDYIQNGIIYYTHILGFRENASACIRLITKNSSIPCITKYADGTRLLYQSQSKGNKMLELDSRATNLYNLLVYNRYHTIIPNDFQHTLVIEKK